MEAVVAAGEGGVLERPEQRLDEVEPAGLGRGEHQRDAEHPVVREEARVVMDQVQVVEDDDQPGALGVTNPQAPEGVAHLVGHYMHGRG